MSVARTADANAEEIYPSYETTDNAAQLRKLVRANPLGDSLQWVSRSGFNFDNAAQKLILDARRARRVL